MSDDFFSLHLDNAPEEEAPRPPSGWNYMSTSGSLRCVFSFIQPVKMGVGVNARTHDSRNYWYVEQVGREMFEARLINDRHTPTGDPVPVTLHDLVGNYTPELAYYDEVVLPAMIEAAQVTHESGAGIDANVVMSLFGLSLVYLSRHEPDRTRALLESLVNVSSDFDGKDQFLFNDLGIALRKSGLYPEAISFFRRALDFVTDDENLYYNLARAYYENNDWEGCLRHLVMSHRINPQLDATRNLLELIVGLDQDQSLLGRYGKPSVPPEVAARAQDVLAAGTGKLTLDEEPVAIGIEPGHARSGGVGVVEIKRHGSDE